MEYPKELYRYDTLGQWPPFISIDWMEDNHSLVAVGGGSMLHQPHYADYCHGLGH